MPDQTGSPFPNRCANTSASSLLRLEGCPARSVRGLLNAKTSAHSNSLLFQALYNSAVVSCNSIKCSPSAISTEPAISSLDSGQPEASNRMLWERPSSVSPHRISSKGPNRVVVAVLKLFRSCSATPLFVVTLQQHRHCAPLITHRRQQQVLQVPSKRLLV